MEVERDHALDKPKKEGEEDPYAESEKELEEAEKQQDEDTGEQDMLPFEALESDAVFDRVLYDGAEFGMQAHPGSAEEQDYLGIPGLLEPDQVQLLLQKRQARQIAHSRKKPDEEADLLELPPSGGRSSRTRSCWSCASGSTRWSPRTTTRAASRTASSTTSCAGCAVVRRARRRRRGSSTSASRRSRSGRPGCAERRPRPMGGARGRC